MKRGVRLTCVLSPLGGRERGVGPRWDGVWGALRGVCTCRGGTHGDSGVLGIESPPVTSTQDFSFVDQLDEQQRINRVTRPGVH